MSGSKKKKPIKNSKINNNDGYTSEEENLDVAQLTSIFNQYSGNEDDIRKSQDFFENCFQNGNAICLICIDKVSRTDAIWCCCSCYQFYHLRCIQKWADNSIYQKQRVADNQQHAGYYNNLGEFVPQKKIEIVFDCPQCRKTYKPSEIPRYYVCFCSKTINPPDHPWNLPHSCGELCDKNLISNCGHKCKILCHPGPCPPCPQMIRTSCNCGKSAHKMIRCSQKYWSCNQKCALKLMCGVHQCEQICHSSDCPPCKKFSSRKCVCGSQSKEVRCDESTWHCNKQCNKFYSCGNHKCEKVCHSDSCGDCPLSFKTCGCGKTTLNASCLEAQVQSCGDTCQKPLNCGIHLCAERCHKGNCPGCLESVKKKCRCGKTEKEFLCSKSFLCDTKCKNTLECGKHPCNRKCCDGDCSNCERVCNKMLSCGRHKCISKCHNGLCYPCKEKQKITCKCGMTEKYVHCGQERKTRLPKCKHPCRMPPKCHHCTKHLCHDGDCPSCSRICMLPLENSDCGHLCQAKCHDYVKVITKDPNFKAFTPGELPNVIVEWKKLDHPLCEVLVEVPCLGNHEITSVPCTAARIQSCGRQCGRKLKCGNHSCKLECHSFTNSDIDVPDKNCEICEEPCSFDRPKGCIHTCPKACHSNPCKKCTVQIKSKCFCGLSDVYYRCCDLNNVNFNDTDKNAAKEKIFSCGNRCIKNYDCGHRCTANCHPGICPDADKCKKKLKLSCKCNNRKVEVSCETIRTKKLVFAECDDVCVEKQKLAEEAENERIKEQERLEVEKKRRDLEEYEKKFNKNRKYKERNFQTEENTNDNKLMIIGVASGAFVLIAIILAYFFT